MADLLEVSLLNGVPVAGNGDVNTVTALLADGGLTTIGKMTDAADAHTDATPITLMQVDKQIIATLASIETLLPEALGSHGGLKVDGSGTALPVSFTTATFKTVQGYAATASRSIPGGGAYTAGDCVGASGSGGAIFTFSNIAPGSCSFLIKNATLRIDRDAVISGETTYDLHLYSSSPPSAYADHDAFDLGSSDRQYYLGYISFSTAVKDLTSTVWSEAVNLNKLIKTTGANLYGYLLTSTSYTPVAANFSVALIGRRV